MNQSKKVFRNQTFLGHNLSGHNFAQCKFYNCKVIGIVESGNFSRTEWDSECDLTLAEFGGKCNVSYMKYISLVKKIPVNNTVNTQYVEPVIESIPGVVMAHCPVCDSIVEKDKIDISKLKDGIKIEVIK